MGNSKRVLNREELILAALSTSEGRPYQPVQVQKLFFLIDKNIGDQLGGPYFDFQAYDYGPFDKEVYQALEGLEKEGLVEIVNSGSWAPRQYRLTQSGQEAGEVHIKKLPKDLGKYIHAVSDYVLRLSFADLVSAIYQAYPDMKVNSVFSR
jgi:uncharacterized protein YwgA